MLKDRKTLSFVKSDSIPTLLHFLEEGESKNYLDDIIMNILAILVKDLEFGESTIEILSQVFFIEISLFFIEF